MEDPNMLMLISSLMPIAIMVFGMILPVLGFIWLVWLSLRFTRLTSAIDRISVTMEKIESHMKG